jgi:xanthine dehydrogenase accessory factor
MTAYSTDREILHSAVEWLQQGHSPALVTVARTWGSSPRPPGSLLLMRDDGVYNGSVSGGCVEEDLVACYRAGELGGFPTMVDYGIDRDQATRLGLPCGGRLELLVERLDSAAPVQALLEGLDAGRLVRRRVCLGTGEVSLHAADGGEDFACDARALNKVFGPRWRMLLIGANHLSRYVAQLALMLDYRVIICDPRDDYDESGLPDGVERVRSMPDDAVHTYITHPRSVVIALTHDPRLDDMALLDALASPAFYVGAIGSQRNSDQRRERLRTLGVGVSQLERLHAPVGLPIGSHAPPEIAVSILAELTALRNRAGQALGDAASAA